MTISSSEEISSSEPPLHNSGMQSHRKAISTKINAITCKTPCRKREALRRTRNQVHINMCPVCTKIEHATECSKELSTDSSRESFTP